jgi:hypothetical protein
MATPASPSPPAQATAAPATTSPPGAFDGTYTLLWCPGGRVTFTLTVANGRGSSEYAARFATRQSRSRCRLRAKSAARAPNLSARGGCEWALVQQRSGGARDGKVALTSTSRGDVSATLDRSGGGASPHRPNAAQRGQHRAFRVLADGTYRGSIPSVCGRGGNRQLAVQMTNGSGTGTVTIPNCGATPIALKVGPSGNVTGEYKYYNANCDPRVARITGQADGGRLTLDVEGVGRTTLTLGGAAPARRRPLLLRPHSKRRRRGTRRPIGVAGRAVARYLCLYCSQQQHKRAKLHPRSAIEA